MKDGEKTYNYKLIYIFKIDDDAHKNLLKIGETLIKNMSKEEEIEKMENNCDELNEIAKNRINDILRTAGIKYQLLHTEVAIFKRNNVYVSFGDKQVHDVLRRSGIECHDFGLESQGREWFKISFDNAKKAIEAVKKGQSSLDPNAICSSKIPMIPRPDQIEAVEITKKNFKKSNKMLWNAKMRFGKTFTALLLIKELNFKHVLILTHEPAVNINWFNEFSNFEWNSEYHYISKELGSENRGKNIDSLLLKTRFLYFVSLQDVRGSSIIGGKYDKNEEIFEIEWDLIIIDEAHEGTLTELGKK